MQRRSLFRWAAAAAGSAVIPGPWLFARCVKLTGWSRENQEQPNQLGSLVVTSPGWVVVKSLESGMPEPEPKLGPGGVGRRLDGWEPGPGSELSDDEWIQAYVDGRLTIRNGWLARAETDDD